MSIVSVVAAAGADSQYGKQAAMDRSPIISFLLDLLITELRKLKVESRRKQICGWECKNSCFVSCLKKRREEQNEPPIISFKQT